MKNTEFRFYDALRAPLHPLSIWLKLASILLISLYLRVEPTHPSWAVLMILIAACLLVPMGFQESIKRIEGFKDLFPSTSNVLSWHLLSVFLLSLSFILSQGTIAALLALPYLLWCAFVFIKTIKMSFKIKDISLIAVWGFLTNASLWCVADRLDFQPWGFSAWIILLTGAHFHYAGFALMLSLTLLLHSAPQDKAVILLIKAILIGVILTAIGITTTQLGFSIFIEMAASMFMAIASFSVGCVWILRGHVEKRTVRILWLSGGFCLMCGMTLALGYALRPVLLVDWLTIPFMQALHGSLNALGFGSLTLIGWSLKA